MATRNLWRMANQKTMLFSRSTCGGHGLVVVNLDCVDLVGGEQKGERSGGPCVEASGATGESSARSNDTSQPKGRNRIDILRWLFLLLFLFAVGRTILISWHHITLHHVTHLAPHASVRPCCWCCWLGLLVLLVGVASVGGSLLVLLVGWLVVFDLPVSPHKPFGGTRVHTHDRFGWSHPSHTVPSERARAKWARQTPRNHPHDEEEESSGSKKSGCTGPKCSSRATTTTLQTRETFIIISTNKQASKQAIDNKPSYCACTTTKSLLRGDALVPFAID